MEVPKTDGNYYGFYIDYSPESKFAHTVAYAWIDLQSSKMDYVYADWPPVITQKGNSPVAYISNAVQLYYIQTAPVGEVPPVGLVNGWELLVSDMKMTKTVYWLDWTGVLIPTGYETVGIRQK